MCGKKTGPVDVISNSVSIEAILFDLGDTIIHFGDVDRRRLFQRAVLRTYRRWSRSSDRMPHLRRYYLHHWFAIHWGFLKGRLLNREIDTMYLLKRASRKLWLNGDKPEEAFYRDLVRDWYEPLGRRVTIEPGLHDVLDVLSRRYRLGLVSNSFIPSFVLDDHLDRLGLLTYFPSRIYSCDVGYRKPDRRIFELGLKSVSSESSRTVFVGDLLKTDILGAERAGMRAIWKGSCEASDSSDRVKIRRITDLPEAICRLKENA